MNLRTLSILATIALGVSAISASEKRGVSENQFSMGCQMRVLTPGVKWYYNWGNVAGSGYHGEVAAFNDMEFVPMCWNANFKEDEIRKYVAEHPECKYLLGFNEPNFKNQANMTPAEAAAQWPRVQALAKELNLKLVSPALNFSPNPPYQDPLKWMDEFVALVGDDAFDYTAIHNYGGLGVMQDLAGQFHEKYGKPVWVTEFCYWPGGAGDVYVAPSTQMASMISTVEWLEKTDYIYRYAWFKAIGASNANNKPNYGLLEAQKGVTESNLTPLGYAYNYLWDFDKDFYAAVGEKFPAANFITSNGIGIDRTNDTESTTPIEVTNFCYGASVQYQFDVPTAGAYTLAVRVTGVGEPERFDPTLAVYAVNEDGTQGDCLCQPKKFELPGNFTDYITLELPMVLNAGKQTLMLKDAVSAQPSDLRLSMVTLASGTGAVDGIAADLETASAIYSIDGTLVRDNADMTAPFEGLAPGVYIMNGRKYMVK